LSNLEGFYFEPRVDIEMIKKYSSDIVALSGPISWDIPYQILAWKSDEEILDRIKFYQDIFWKENFYLELLYHSDIPKQELVTNKLIELHKKYDIPVVAANDTFYIEKEDKQTQDVIMCLNTGHTMDNPDRPTLINWDYSFLTEEEMQMQFGHVPSALSNTQKIADQINIEFETGSILIPKYDLPQHHQKIYEKAQITEEKEAWLKKLTSDEWYLRYLCFAWLNDRYDYGISEEIILEFVKKLDKPSLDKVLQETSPEELKDLSITYYTDKKKEILADISEEIQEKVERLEYELVVVHEMWFDGYFLIVADYINWARKEDIPVWPWRWSAAGALLAYLSWITDIDPLKYSLLFERFLNPARVSMPDIDTDFSDDARDKVIEYCRNKYWADHVAQICTFWTFAARAAVKDVWRVFGVEFQEMNKLAALIPEKPGTKLAKALEEAPEFQMAYRQNPKYTKIIDNALKIEWNVRQIWVHACAVIIAPEKMTNFTALQNPPKDKESIITQYSAYPLEDLWLLKMDFLWLRNLTIIQRAQKIIERSKWDKVDILDINLEDPKVFEIFAAWDTTWVFQFESDWMRKYLKDLWPNTFEDIIVMVSLYRPGPLQYIPTYIDRKHGREEVEYAHESLKKILEPTQWIAVYQEQIMQMVQAFAGFSLWEADILRRAIWKKKIDVLMEQKWKFVKAAAEQGHSEKLALHIFEDVIEPFAGYWFNKSHAACYAFIAYQTAFLKAYYPTEFLASVMTSDEENMERIVMEVWEAESKWISVLPPNVNESLKHFTYIDDKNIRFWFKAIKWVWDGPIEWIIKAREEGWKFNSLEDFIKRTWKDVINKRVLEALIKSWALDDFGERWQMWNNIAEMLRFVKNEEKKESSSQIWLFELAEDEDFSDKLVLEECEAFSYAEKLDWEQEMIWFWVSGHPLDGLKRYIKWQTKWASRMVKSFEDYAIEKEEEEKKKQEEKEKKKNAQITEAMEWWEVKPQNTQNKFKKKWKREYENLVQTAWYILDVRTFMTKNGKNMLVASFENYYWSFEITVFDRHFEALKDKIKAWKFVVLEWSLSVNTEYLRKSVLVNEPAKVQTLSLDFIRSIAKKKWIFDESKFNRFLQDSEEIELDTEELENKDIKTEKTWENNKIPEKIIQEVETLEEERQSDEKCKVFFNNPIEEYIIPVPVSAQKEDLVDMKLFMQDLEEWETEIFIEIRGNKLPTKMKIKDHNEIKNWAENKWWIKLD